MSPSADHYAYRAEAALSYFADAHLMRNECENRERHACVLFARSARCALAALCASQGVPVSDTLLNLQSPVACLSGSSCSFGRSTETANAHARWLSRVLILDQHDAGADYVTRDLFDESDVLRCEAAAQFFVDRCCRHLLHTTWEQALIRFLPFREPPMTHTTLWQRRARHFPTARKSN